MQQIEEYCKNLLEFIAASPTACHVVAGAQGLLEKSGFVELSETQSFAQLPAGRYFVCRNDSSMLAFTWSGSAGTKGLQFIGAHTDSPCLKVKPCPVQEKENYLQLGVEVYGGALLNPWFDRELSLAGRVCWYDGEKLHAALIDFRRPVAIIPSLAIHLDREANTKRSINKQTDIVPVIGLTDENGEGFHKMLLEQLCQEHPGMNDPEITDFDLYLYDAQPPALAGINNELIIGARLDNQLSCFAALQALQEKNTAGNCFVILSDHEEVGSMSTTGAQGTFLQDMLARLLPDPEQRLAVLRQSFFISVDNAHAMHPNFSSKHDPEHLPLLNRGPVIKWNANQRYATTAATASRFRLLCHGAQVPVQEFVMRNDMACGSTIGPLTATRTGVDTVDVGIASLAMHSIRETAGRTDCWYLYNVLTHFFSCSPLNGIEKE